ncbi:MAG: hypothetical protein ACRCXM_09200 [Beijerinckiaceae bacterium]
MTTSAPLKKITLHLARTKEFPDGSMRHGYEFVAPLDAQNHIDQDVWQKHKAACTVRRFWADEAPLHGHLVHRAGGAKGATWGFDYNIRSDDDDEAGYRFGDHAFVVGEYVSVRDPEGELHTFKIVNVRAA